MADQVEIPKDDPLNDPTIDWGSAVHETEVVLNDNLEVVEADDSEEEEDEAATDAP